MGKFYAVRKGKNIGIYTTWPECQEQITGFPKAEFKSFKTQEEAENYLLQKNEASNADAPRGDEVFLYYSLKKKDASYKLAVGFQSENTKTYYLTNLDITYDIYYTRLYAVLVSLELATSLGYKNIRLFFDDMSVHNYISREWNPLKGKNKELTTDYSNLFMLISEANHIFVDFSAIPEHSMMHKRLQSIIKNTNSTNHVSVDDIKKMSIGLDSFDLV